MTSQSGIELSLYIEQGAFSLAIDATSPSGSLGLFGPSGCGKTTALECIAGWRKMHSGVIRFAGRTIYDSARKIDLLPRDRRIGYVPQDALLFPHWSVEKNLRSAARFSEAALARSIDVLGIAELINRSPNALSGGEVRRVALARALASSPELLLLDEPLAALDVPLRRRVLGDLLAVRDAFKIPMIFVSHDATEIQTLCDDVVVIESGRVVDSGRSVDCLRRRSGTVFENVFEGVVVATTDAGTRVKIADDVEIVALPSKLNAGTHVVLGIDADDVMVAADPIGKISARNVLPARCENLVRDGAFARFEACLGSGGKTRLLVHLTAAAVGDLGLRETSVCRLVFKSSSCRIVAVGR